VKEIHHVGKTYSKAKNTNRSGWKKWPKNNLIINYVSIPAGILRILKKD